MSYKPATSNKDKGVLSKVREREREKERRIWRNVRNPLRSKYSSISGIRREVGEEIVGNNTDYHYCTYQRAF